MNEEHPESDFESRRFEELSAQVASNHADIEGLHTQADRADQRARVSEDRAAVDRGRIGDLEVRAEIDREMITQLQADGILSRSHAAQLEVALGSSRRIGAAIGIVMAHRKVNEVEAFQILCRASQNANTKLRHLADEVVYTGDVTTLPGL